MAQTFDIKDLERRMRAGIDTLKKEFAGLRTGRASTHLLDPVHVMIYGSRMPLAQCATVSTPDAKTISVQVWDKSAVKAVEKAISEANLGLTPKSDGSLIRLSVPPLSGEPVRQVGLPIEDDHQRLALACAQYSFSSFPDSRRRLQPDLPGRALFERRARSDGGRIGLAVALPDGGAFRLKSH